MANLLEIAEVAYRQVFPNPNDETPITREEFVSTAKTEYAYHMWRMSKEEVQSEGMFNVPSHLLKEEEFPVVNNEIDVSKINTLRSLADDTWLQNVGGVMCECRYVRSTVNLMQVLCDDDSISGSDRLYYVVGNKVKLPRGAHKTPLSLIYAKSGDEIDEEIIVDDAIGGIVRGRLIEIYGGRVGKEDETNNSNSNN